MKNKNVRSPLNHLGNKYRIINEIEKIFETIPKNTTFVDVFGGSGLVGINLHFNKIIYNELNKKLYEIVNVLISKNKEEIIDKIQEIIFENKLKIADKNSFIKLREKYNKKPEVFILLTLVLFSFNSQIRFNSKGEFNVPVGKSGLTKYRENNIRQFNDKAKEKNIKFYNLDFEKIVLKVMSSFSCDEVIFYFDPPYLISNATYNYFWKLNEEKRLLKTLKFLIENNYKFVLSNFIENKSLINEELFLFINKYKLKVVNLNSNYNFSNYQRKKTITKEILVFNF